MAGVQELTFGDGDVIEAQVDEKGVKKAARQARKRKRSEKKASAVDAERAKKYQRGPGNSAKGITSSRLRKKIKQSEKEIKEATESAARAEILLPEEAGYLEAEGINRTWRFKQDDLRDHVDERTQKKIFDLKLDVLGPYTLDYTRNGRHLLLAGRKGHLAVMDWADFKLSAEFQVKETVRDAKFLHDQTMLAVAQKRYVYVYDNRGVELQVVRELSDVNRLDFLPYHWLLCTVGKAGVLKYYDTSTQVMVAEHKTRQGEVDVMRQNPRNAVMLLGHTNGRVTMWSPNMTTPLVQMLAHRGPVQSLCVDTSGQHLVTTGLDGQVKVWDVRTYKELHSYFTVRPASTVDISDQGQLSLGFGPHVQVWKDALRTKQQAPYIVHQLPGKTVQRVRFCPFEDVLGIAHSDGFSSIVVPGSGEPNFDTFEANPFETRKQRRERMVHSLLEKLQPDMISLDPLQFGLLDKDSKMLLEGDRKAAREAKEKEQLAKTLAKNKSRGRNKASKRYLKKQINIIDQRALEKRERVLKEAEERQQRAKNAKRSAKGTAAEASSTEGAGADGPPVSKAGKLASKADAVLKRFG